MCCWLWCCPSPYLVLASWPACSARPSVACPAGPWPRPLCRTWDGPRRWGRWPAPWCRCSCGTDAPGSPLTAGGARTGVWTNSHPYRPPWKTERSFRDEIAQLHYEIKAKGTRSCSSPHAKGKNRECEAEVLETWTKPIIGQVRHHENITFSITPACEHSRLPSGGCDFKPPRETASSTLKFRKMKKICMGKYCGGWPLAHRLKWTSWCHTFCPRLQVCSGDSSYPDATPTPRKAVKGAKEASVRPADPPYLASRLWTSGGSW